MREPYQQRVIDEANELFERWSKLNVFIETNGTFSELPADEQKRLRDQLAVMKQYNEILLDRIDHFPKDAATAS